MKVIPMDIVEKIYKDQYWNAMSCDSFPFSIAFQLFDAAVNHGLLNARKLLQRAVGVKDDGIVGALTLAAVRKTPQLTLVYSIQNALSFIQRFPLSKYLVVVGWRVAVNLKYGVEDVA